MPKLLLSNVPCSEEFLQGLTQNFPEVDSFSFYTYLTLRKVSGDLENCLERYFSSYGISAGRFMLLLVLISKPQGLMPSELAQQCGVTQATISGLLSGLEKTQLILRETHTQDRRAYVIKLSRSGRDLLDIIKPEFLKCVHTMMDQFSSFEKEQLVSSLSRFGNGLKQITELKTFRNSTTN